MSGNERYHLAGGLKVRDEQAAPMPVRSAEASGPRADERAAARLFECCLAPESQRAANAALAGGRREIIGC